MVVFMAVSSKGEWTALNVDANSMRGGLERAMNAGAGFSPCLPPRAGAGAAVARATGRMSRLRLASERRGPLRLVLRRHDWIRRMSGFGILAAIAAACGLAAFLARRRPNRDRSGSGDNGSSPGDLGGSAAAWFVSGEGSSVDSGSDGGGSSDAGGGGDGGGGGD
jgi:hypothetical protein